MVLKISVLLAAIAQIVAAATLSVGTFENSEKAFTVFIQPAGWAFSIWGLIYALSLIYAVYQLLPQYENELLQQTRLPAVIGFVGSILWLLFAGQTDWLIWLTIPVLLSMAFSFTFVIRAEAAVSKWTRFFSQHTLFPYAAWTGVASWLNIQSVAAEEGLITSSAMNLVTNTVLFAALVLFSLYYLYRSRFNVWYGGVLVWAASGVVYANLSGMEGSELFAILAGVYGLGVLLLLIRAYITKG